MKIYLCSKNFNECQKSSSRLQQAVGTPCMASGNLLIENYFSFEVNYFEENNYLGVYPNDIISLARDFVAWFDGYSLFNNLYFHFLHVPGRQAWRPYGYIIT